MEGMPGATRNDSSGGDAAIVSQVGFRSFDGHSDINALLWTPPNILAHQLRAIIQIAHGMEEYIGRYEEFARFLCSQGFAVCAHDYIGHGGSVADESELSCIPARQGKHILLEDMHTLHMHMKARLPENLPYILFGHSMGSFLVRSYITHYPEHLDAVIICGTGQQPPALSKMGNLLARFLAAVRGEEYRSTFLDNMGVGAYSKRIDNPRTSFDWLSVDEAVVDAYIADPLCGVLFTVGGYAALTDLTGEIASAASAEKVPKDLPVFLIAGALDPVGDFGKGVEQVADQLRNAGVLSVDVKLYDGLRHEILNEPSRQEVYRDVVEWIEGTLCRESM